MEKNDGNKKLKKLEPNQLKELNVDAKEVESDTFDNKVSIFDVPSNAIELVVKSFEEEDSFIKKYREKMPLVFINNCCFKCFSNICINMLSKFYRNKFSSFNISYFVD